MVANFQGNKSISRNGGKYWGLLKIRFQNNLLLEIAKSKQFPKRLSLKTVVACFDFASLYFFSKYLQGYCGHLLGQDNILFENSLCCIDWLMQAFIYSKVTQLSNLKSIIT